MRPVHIYHADWGTTLDKRWLARATLGSNGRYRSLHPARVENHPAIIPSIEREVGKNGCALVGFDFPIGIPIAYARRAGVKAFKPFLRNLGQGQWHEFYNVAHSRLEISVGRPFYPFKPGHKMQAHLIESLGVGHIDELRRECEKKQVGRRAACPLFWTLGANQVGKGAIIGWRDVLAPALRNDGTVRIWPFDGLLNECLRPGAIVIAETYPTECYGWFSSRPLKGKTKQETRRRASDVLLERARSIGLDLDCELIRAMESGFPEGDDAFDAVVGLFGMVEVAIGKRQPGEPTKTSIRELEGWILGQASAMIAKT